MGIICCLKVCYNLWILDFLFQLILWLLVCCFSLFFLNQFWSFLLSCKTVHFIWFLNFKFFLLILQSLVQKLPPFWIVLFFFCPAENRMTIYWVFTWQALYWAHNNCSYLVLTETGNWRGNLSEKSPKNLLKVTQWWGPGCKTHICLTPKSEFCPIAHLLLQLCPC